MNGQGLQLVLGDLNSHGGKSPEVLELFAKKYSDAWLRGGIGGNGKTAPAPNPAVRIDYVMLGSAFTTPVTTWVPAAATQSDHRPVVSSLIKPWSQSLYGDREPPTKAVTDTRAVEVGVKVRFQKSGKVQGVRFYRGKGNPNGYRINLWTPAGKLLATAKVGNEGPGWVEAGFSQPVPVVAGQTYIASYFTSNGGFAREMDGHASAIRSGDLVAPAATATSGTGLLKFSASSTFPTNFNGQRSYFVDVRFRPDP